jgi:hypothetical protein
MSEIKVCIDCNESKDKIDFYVNRNKCKSCVRKLQMCPHNKQKNLCIDCGGVTICSHVNLKVDVQIVVVSLYVLMILIKKEEKTIALYAVQ